MSIYNKEYYEKTKSLYAERQRRYKKKHREKINLKQKLFRSETKEAQRIYSKKRYDYQKQYIENIKNNSSCKICGFSDKRALVFHHKDPNLKSFEISQKIGKVSIKRILSEIEKCDVLCANCHQIHHQSIKLCS